MNLLELFCSVDDFTQTFQATHLQKAFPNTKKSRARKLSMHPSEIMTFRGDARREGVKVRHEPRATETRSPALL